MKNIKKIILIIIVLCLFTFSFFLHEPSIAVILLFNNDVLEAINITYPSAE